MSTPTYKQARAARNRIIDVLGFSETYPLQDVKVQKTLVTVLYNTPLTCTIEDSQVGVEYTLCEDYVPLSPSPSTSEEGGLLVLNGPNITEDRTFQILARKAGAGDKRPEAFLHQTVTAKVGLDKSIRAWIHDAPALNPSSIPPQDTDARIIDYGGTVEVRIADTQVGVSYHLFYVGPGGAKVSTEPKPGVGGGAEISLVTPPIFEDTNIGIQATRDFDESGGLEDLSEPLDAALPLAVRANPDVAVSIVGSPLVDPDAPATLRIDGSQASVGYSVFIRTLLDADFDVSDPAEAEAITVPASLDVSEHTVLVKRPARPSPWAAQAGFTQLTQLGEPLSVKGTDGPLEIPLGMIHDDSVIVVRARKEHAGPKPKESALQLKQSAVALTRPDSAPDLVVSPYEPGGSGAVLVTGGQRGVFYHFRAGAELTELGLPAYFHELDKGLGHLKVQVNLVVPRDAPAGEASGDLGEEATPPPPPVVELDPLPSSGVLIVSAVKARTGVAWLNPQEILIDSTP
ncbi:MAG TPA: hypothetical protein VE093_09820 [Polyangiaceae bacterium]|nr:hypothetical protein [Polyangiaceae bacterium]